MTRTYKYPFSERMQDDMKDQPVKIGDTLRIKCNVPPAKTDYIKAWLYGAQAAYAGQDADLKKAEAELTSAREKLLSSKLGDKLSWDRTSVHIVGTELTTEFKVVKNPWPLILFLVVIISISLFAGLKEIEHIIAGPAGFLFLPLLLIVAVGALAVYFLPRNFFKNRQPGTA